MREKLIHLTTQQYGDYPIFLGTKLTSNPFEKVLIEHWDKTQQATGRIIFVLEEVQWTSLTEVLMLTMWSLHLRKLRKIVAVCLPFCRIFNENGDTESKLKRRKAVCSFLSRWRFSKILDESGIAIYGIDQPYFSWTERDDPFYCRVLPISFFTKEDKDYIGNLKLESIVQQILSEHSCLDPFESRVFSDILFHEIAKNIFDHASSDEHIPGLISIGMIKKNIWAEGEHGEWDSFYFQNLGEKSYLQIVLSDHGKGIYKTLIEAYKNDKHLNRQRYYKDGKRCDDEPFVLRYALDKLSSRHTEKSRLQFYDIPRGLAWVSDVVREYRGFLSIRSGSTRIGISFLPGHDGELRYDDNPLAEFGGTILQIVLPEYKSEELLTFHLASEPFLGKHPNLHLISVADYWNGQEEDQESYGLLLENLDKIVRPLDENDLVLIDFSGIYWNKNTLSEFIRKIMYLQGDTLIVGFNINFNHFKLLTTEIKNVFLSDDNLIGENDIRITPFIDIHGKPFFLGCKEEYENNLLYELAEVGESDLSVVKDASISDKIGKFIRRNRHIIRRSGDKLKIKASMLSFSELFDEAIRNEVEEVFNNPPEGITIKHTGLFHLPSGKYANKYIQLGHLLQMRNWAQKLAYTLLTKIHLKSENNPKDINFIFGCTASTYPLIESIAEGLSFNPDDNCLCIETYLDSLGHPDIEEIPEGKNVLLVTDIISTGGLVKRMMEAVISRKAYPFAVAAIVDTRESFESEVQVNDIKVKVYALYHEPIQKDIQPIKLNKKGQADIVFDKKNIIEIDRLTATPVYELSYSPSPIIDPKVFFDLISKSSYAVINRHVTTGGTHFCFYIDTKEIFQNLQIRPELIDKIINCLKRDLEDGVTNLLTILYPWGSNAKDATSSLESAIRKTFNIKGITVRSIFRSKSKRGWRFGSPDKSYESVIKDKTIIIWDDGSNSGDTLSQLIDYTYSFKPKKVLVYILVSRFEPFYRKFFQKIKSYSITWKNEASLNVTFITALDLPTYRPNNCPVCEKRRSLKTDSLEPFAALEPVKNHIEREEKRLKDFRLKDIQNEIKAKEYFSMSELSNESEQFRSEIANLIMTREIVAKLEALVSTEDDRILLREHTSDKENLKMLGRIIRDEPEVLTKITPQCPDVIEHLMNLCKDTLISNDDPNSFDLVAIEILFNKKIQQWIIDNLNKIILRLQYSEEAINSFIYHVIKFSDEDDMVEILEKCRNICEENRTNVTILEGITRVKISKAIQWVRLKRAKNAGLKGPLKEAIVSLENIYNQDPHAGAIEVWNKLIVTSLNAGPESWAIRYKWWREELNPFLGLFVKNLETLQPVLSHMTNIHYLLTDSMPNYTEDITALDEDLHTLCLENAEMISRKTSYDDFQSIVNRLHGKVISKESLLSKIIKEVPTNLSQRVNYILQSLKDELENKRIRLDMFPTTIPYEIKILFHKNLFDKVFKEFLQNMCKHGSENVTATLSINISEKVVSISLIHPGTLQHSELYGIGKNMMEEIVHAHNGSFEGPKEIGRNKIESTIKVHRW